MTAPLLFLSHAGEEEAAARELARLLDRAGVPVWLDVERLRPGDRWMESLEEALGDATAFAVYVGRSGVARWVGQEVRVALDRSVAEEGFTVIPILGPGADPEELPVFLRQHQWVDLRDGLDDAEGLRELAEVVVGEDRRGERLRRSLLPPDRAPFLGLRPFGEEDAFLFYGRDREVEELLAALGADAFLAVVGASGCGKSSLVRAGLLPALRRGRAPGDGEPTPGSGGRSGSPLASWRIAVFRPADDPFRELAAALPDLDPELGAAERMEVGARIASSPGDVERAVAALVPAGTRTLLVADQLEEVFTQTADPDVRRRLLDALLAAGRLGGDRPVHVLVTLRADFYSRCWEHPDLPRRIAANQYPVERMARDQLREVVEKPLALAGVTPEPGLADELLDDAGDEPGNLPLLEHALFQLWDQPAGRRFTHEAYREMGGLAGALEHHAETVFEGFDAQGRGLARRLFLRLAVVGEAGAVTRRRVAKADLLAVAGAGEEERTRAAGVLGRLVEARLLTATGGGEGPGEERVEVAHEALLRSWDRLRAWLEEDREFLLWRQRLADAVAAWERSGRSDGELLRGGPLRRAESWLERRRDDLTPAEEELVEASLAQEAVERERRVAQARKLAAAVGGVALLLLVALAAAVWFYQREERRSRMLRAGNIAAQVETMAGTRPQLGALLALHALRLAEGAGEPGYPAAETGLRAALARLGGRVVGDPAEKVLDGAVIEGAVLLAVTDREVEGGTLRLRAVPLPLQDDWEIARGEATVVMEERVSQVLLAPSGRWLAASAENRPVRVWRVQDRGRAVTPVALRREDEPLEVQAAELRWYPYDEGGREEVLVLEGLDGEWTFLLPPEPRENGPFQDAAFQVAGGPSPPVVPGGPFFEACNLLDPTWLGTLAERGTVSLPKLWWQLGLVTPPTGCALGGDPNDRLLLTWNPDTPARLSTLGREPPLFPGPDPRLLLAVRDDWPFLSEPQLRMAPGGGWFSVRQPGGVVEVWEVEKRADATRVRCDGEELFSALWFTADGSRLVLQVSGSGRLCVLGKGDEEALHLDLPAEVPPGSGILAGPEASWMILFESSGGVLPVEPGCADQPEPLRGHLGPVVAAAASPGGGAFASADEHGVLHVGRTETRNGCTSFRWMPTSGGLVKPFTELALSEHQIAVGRADGELEIRGLDEAPDQAVALPGHAAGMAHLAFSRAGDLLASADHEDGLLLWKRPGPERVPVRIDLVQGIGGIAFREDGSELLVAHEQGRPEYPGQVYAFTLDLDRLKTLACRAAGRDLSVAEAREYLGEEDPPRVCPGLPRGVD